MDKSPDREYLDIRFDSLELLIKTQFAAVNKDIANHETRITKVEADAVDMQKALVAAEDHGPRIAAVEGKIAALETAAATSEGRKEGRKGVFVAIWGGFVLLITLVVNWLGNWFSGGGFHTGN